MSYILAIETSTKNCSVGIFKEADLVGFKEEISENYSHSERLTLFIEEIFKEAQIKKEQLDAVAVSQGPGSYTGLRIGTATAKGICYGLGIPLIAISTLQAMAFSMQRKEISDLYSPMIDARRMEVYSAIYNSKNEIIRDIQADIINDMSYQSELKKKVVFFGDNISKCEKIIKHKNARFINNIFPSVKDIGILIHERFQKEMFEDLTCFEPFYLKDFISGNQRK